MGTPEYSWEKFYVAVKTLASGREDIRTRLSDAYWHSLHSLTGAPMPWSDLDERFQNLRESLIPEISSGNNAKQRLSEEELSKFSHEIVDIFDRICARHERPNY